MGREVSGIVVSDPTAYIRLHLHGDMDTTSSFVILIVQGNSVWSFDVAVAINAIKVWFYAANFSDFVRELCQTSRTCT